MLSEGERMSPIYFFWRSDGGNKKPLTTKDTKVHEGLRFRALRQHYASGTGGQPGNSFRYALPM
jgi:hypothetical protein